MLFNNRDTHFPTWDFVGVPEFFLNFSWVSLNLLNLLAWNDKLGGGASLFL